MGVKPRACRRWITGWTGRDYDRWWREAKRDTGAVDSNYAQQEKKKDHKKKLGGSLIQPVAIIRTLQCASDEKWQQQPSPSWLSTRHCIPLSTACAICHGWQCNSGAGRNKSSSTASISGRCFAAWRSTLSESSSAMPPLSPWRQRFTLCRADWRLTSPTTSSWFLEHD